MITRGVYRVLLRLHPAAFRERFGAEMLWVFDQMTGAEQRSVLCDGAISVVTQWWADAPQPRMAMFGRLPADSMSALRVTQATVVAAALTLGFFKLLAHPVPLPLPSKNFEVRRAAWALCRIYSHPLERYPGGAPDCRSLQ